MVRVDGARRKSASRLTRYSCRWANSGRLQGQVIGAIGVQLNIEILGELQPPPVPRRGERERECQGARPMSRPYTTTDGRWPMPLGED